MSRIASVIRYKHLTKVITTARIKQNISLGRKPGYVFNQGYKHMHPDQ
jgi:hypothetical protein